MLQIYRYNPFDNTKNTVVSLVHGVVTDTLIVGKIRHLCIAEFLFSKE